MMAPVNEMYAGEDQSWQDVYASYGCSLDFDVSDDDGYAHNPSIPPIGGEGRLHDSAGPPIFSDHPTQCVGRESNPRNRLGRPVSYR